MKIARNLLSGDPIYVVRIIGDEFCFCEKVTIMRIRHKRNRHIKIITSDEYNNVVFDNAAEQMIFITPCEFYIRAFSTDIIYDKYSTWSGKILSLNEFKRQLSQKLKSNLNSGFTVQNSLIGTVIPYSVDIIGQINEHCPISVNPNNY